MVCRVLALVKGLGPGGAEHLLITEAKTYDRQRFAVDVAYVLATHDELAEPLRAQGVTVRCLGGPRGVADPRWVLRLRSVMAGGEYDVVHVHSPVPAVACRLLARTIRRRRRPAIVSTEHNTWSSHHVATRLANRLTFRLGDAWLAVSTAVRDSLPPALRGRVEILVHGIVLRDFDVADHRAAVRESLGVGPDEVLVLTVANLRRTKGYPDLLTAARTVVDRNPGVRFFAVGQGPMEAELRERATALGLDGHVRFLGYRTDVIALLGAADVFAMASHFEGYPIAVMEAMAAGVPVVATTVGGIPDAVADGEDGLLVPPNRPDALAGAVLRLASDAGLRASMAATAREAARRFDITVAVRRMEAIYLDVSAARP